MANAVQWRRRLFLGLIATLAVAGLYLGFRPQPILIDAGIVDRGPLRVTIEQEGRTRVVDRYVVSAPVAAFAQRIDLEVGDAVAQGAPLARLEPVRAEILDARRRAEAEARVAATRSAIGAAEQRMKAAAASADLAQKNLERVRTLRADSLVSADAEDRAKTEAERAAAELLSAQFALKTTQYEMEAARTALKYGAESSKGAPVIVRAPVAGRVLAIPHESEGAVVAGQALIEIGDPSRLEVEIDVLSADAVRLHPGTKVEFHRWGGDGALLGEVHSIDPVAFTKVSALGVEEQRVWVIVTFTSPIAQWQRLGSGYRVEAAFILWDEPDVLRVPGSALFRDGDNWAVFVIEQGRAVHQPVTVGQRNGLQAQVISGLREGDHVIVHPDDQIETGVRVAVR